MKAIGCQNVALNSKFMFIYHMTGGPNFLKIFEQENTG